MARVCDICGKRPGSGHKVSNSYRHTKRRWLPNLQHIRVQTAGGSRRQRVCTSCLKAGKVRRPG